MSPGQVGRPPSDDPRVAHVRIRVTPGEKETLLGAAAAAGKPLAEWLRELGLRAASRKR